jgi:hypothetical protein
MRLTVLDPKQAQRLRLQRQAQRKIAPRSLADIEAC